MATNLFFPKDDLRNVLVCAFCTKKFDVPKALPCGKIICSSCESENFKSSKRKNCGLCQDYHERPENGFPVSDLIQKLLKITPKTVYRGELHEKAMESINKVGALNRKFANEISNLESMVSEHCDLLRDNVDLKTECVIDAIQTHREKFLNEINEYQKQCFTKCKNLKEFKTFMLQSKCNYDRWVYFMNRVDIKDKEINDVLKESNKLLNKLNIQEEKLDIHVFGAQKLQFVENESKLSSNLLGRLTYLGVFNTGLNNLLQNKPEIEINYKKEDQTMRYNSTICMKIDDGRFCIAVSMLDQYRGYHCLKLKLFSKDGRFIKEISEQLFNGQFQFGATKIKESIVIQAFTVSGYNALKSYNHDLGLIKTINANYYNSTLFTDNDRLYVYSASYNYWTMYDEALNQLDSTVTGDGTKYPFIPNNASQVELKYGRIFIYYNLELTVVDNKTHKILKRIKLGQEYANVDMIVKPTSSETFMTICPVSKYLRVFDFDLECLREFQIENIKEISSISLTGDNNIVICDNQQDKIFVF